ncbi:hypothetical protein CN627_21470 [Bacillus wiedmannii]|nr:hypothetical protein CN627_21470 [Bacillus wiedmannii]
MRCGFLFMDFRPLYLQCFECILLLDKLRISGDSVRSQCLKGNECKLIFKSLLWNRIKKSPMFMGFFFIILYQLNIDDSLVRVYIF